MQPPSDPDRASRGERRRLLLALGLHRALLLAVVLLSLVLLPPLFSEGNFRANFHWPVEQKVSLATAFETWDAQHFLFLAQHGYQRAPPAEAPFNAFYPLWPLLIRAGAALLGSPLVAALMLSNALAIAGLWLFHGFARRRLGSDAADACLLLMLAFPSAYVLGLPYSESLFLLLVVVFLSGLIEGRDASVASAGFLLALTRAVGLFLVVPIVAHVLLAERRPRRLLLAAFPVLGFATYLGMMQWTTGDAFTGFAVYRGYVGRAEVARIWDLGAFARAFWPAGGLSPHGFTDSLLDRLVFVAFAALLPLMARLGPGLFAYALVAGVVPAMANGFMSYTRYALLALPLFLALGASLAAPAHRHARALLAAGLLALQLLLLLRHVNAHWAG